MNAVADGYPLRGTLRIADVPFGVARSTDSIPHPGEVWLDARIVAQLGLKTGDALRVGATTLRFTEVLDYRPDQGTGFVDLAPALLMNVRDISRDPPHRTGQPGDVRGTFRGARARGRGVPRLFDRAQAPGGTPAPGRRRTAASWIRRSTAPAGS